MLTINGLEYRNLEEQVRKNKEDILYILEEESTLNAFGIKVVGQIADVSGLPDPVTYTGEFGDAYAVGTESPYVLYIYTRANGTHPNNYWFNIGRFPVPGPKGDKGDSGIGNAKLSNTPGTSNTDGYTQKAVNGIVQNPNLLINPNFVINQRGQSSYSPTTKSYTVDRTNANRGVFEPVAGGGIKMNLLSGQSNPYIQQIIENATALVGKILTFSVSIDGVVYSHTITTPVPSANSTTVYYNKNLATGNLTTNLQLTKYKPNNADDSVLLVTFTIANPNDTIVNWWKLEIGSVATQFTPPNIAEELLKCQRYYIDLASNGIGSYLVGTGSIYTSRLVYILVPTPSSLRRYPTLIKNTERLSLFINGNIVKPSVLEVIGTNKNGVTLRSEITDDSLTGQSCVLRLDNATNNTGVLAFDAEL